MSMYTQLLGAALEQRSSRDPAASRGDAVEEVRRCREELEAGVLGDGVDTVPAVLALQIGYDVALIELAGVVGIESGPSWFEQPERERDRLRRELRDLGISFDTSEPMAADAERGHPRA